MDSEGSLHRTVAYGWILHVESGTQISSDNARVAREGHLLATFQRAEDSGSDPEPHAPLG